MLHLCAQRDRIIGVVISDPIDFEAEYILCMYTWPYRCLKSREKKSVHRVHMLIPSAPLPRLCPSLPIMAAVFMAERSSVYLGVKCLGTFLHVCVYLHPCPLSSVAFAALWLSPESSLCLWRPAEQSTNFLPVLAPCAAPGIVHAHGCLRVRGAVCVSVRRSTRLCTAAGRAATVRCLRSKETGSEALPAVCL